MHPKKELEVLTMNRCVIIGAARIGDYAHMRKIIRDEDFVIYCDGGLMHFSKDGLDRAPDLVVGDFDSYQLPEGFADTVETIVLPCEKDDTDTVYAMKEALRRGYKDFLFLGVIGERLDHTLGNVYMLEYLAQAGVFAKLRDDFSEIQMISAGETVYVEDCFRFSLLNISGTAQGITINGAKYPLQNGTIESRYQYGISNETLPGEKTTVSLEEGSLLLIRVLKRS